MKYISPRLTYVKAVTRGYRLIDKMRLFLAIPICMLPRRIKYRGLAVNKAVKGVIVSSLNRVFILYTYDNVSHVSPEFERDISSWFKIDPESDFIDVGANIGRWSILLSKRTMGTILAFEPCKSTFKCLKRNVELNDAENVIPLNVGLSDEDSIEYLNITAYSGSNSIMLKKPDVIRKERIVVKRLDDIIQDYSLNHIALIKIDVEGYEVHVLNGMKETLCKHKPRLIIEVKEQNEKAVFAFLKEINYHIKNQIDEDILAVSAS